MAPGFEDAAELEQAKSSEQYWARKPAVAVTD
jgi:hypothetical protein